VRRHLEHLSTRRLGLQVQLRPKYGRSLGCVGRLSADLDLILGDVLIQAGEEVLRQVVSPVDAPVVAYELVAGHLFGHLNAYDKFRSVIDAPIVAYELVAGHLFGHLNAHDRLRSVIDAPVVAYELVAGHLFGHLNAHDRLRSVIGAPVVAYELVAGHLFGHLNACRFWSVIDAPVISNVLVAGILLGSCMHSRLCRVMHRRPTSRMFLGKGWGGNRAEGLRNGGRGNGL